MEPDSFIVRNATNDDLFAVSEFLQPFMDQKFILPRTSIELELLLRHAFVAESNSRVVGFVSLEIYSRKLAEIQCLAVSSDFQRRGIARQLVSRCVERAKAQNVLELMAITATEKLFHDCGFEYALPGQKRALFIQTNDQ